MLRKSLTLAGAATTIALLAGCGSSSTTTSSPAASAASSTQASTASTAPASTSASHGVVVTTKHGRLGTILAAGPKKMTVYLFEADRGTTATCTGPCAQGWPPVISSGAPQATGQALAADLGTTTRADGSKQVTYNGHPLYFFVKDGDAGDSYGQDSTAFGAGWYVLAPGGNKVEHASGGEHS